MQNYLKQTVDGLNGNVLFLKISEILQNAIYHIYHYFLMILILLLYWS